MDDDELEDCQDFQDNEDELEFDIRRHVFAEDQFQQSDPAPQVDSLKAFLQKLDEEHHSEDEGIEDYKIGGYHPVHIGEVLVQRYVIIQKLGWGHFSTVWLAKDFKYDNYVAIKIMKSAPHYIEAAYDQVQILQKVAKNVNHPQWIRSLKEYQPHKKHFNRDDTHVVHMLNSFLFKGPYGNHFCMVFEILGVNLLQILKRYDFQGVPMDICKEISRQVMMGLDFLHRICKVIHTDLKPQNVLVCLTQKEIKEIVENGQLQKNQLFSQRIQIYQQCMGIKPKTQTVSSGNLSPEIYQQFDAKLKQAQEKLRQISDKLSKQLNKTQKKNLKKKKKKAQEILESVQKQIQDSKKAFHAVKSKKTLNQLFGHDGRVKFDRGPKLEVGKFSVKIADLGNACWTHHHFATQIQTRQYRSPQVLLGSMYDTSADMWSMACMTFEMLTSELLFNPHKDNQYEAFGKNDDHIAQIMQLMGRFPKNFSLRGVKAKKYMSKDGKLKRINKISQYTIKDVIMGKHKVKDKQAQKFANFLLPMLECVPQKRATARQMLRHKWLYQPSEPNIKMSDQEYQLVYDKIKNSQYEANCCYDSENEAADNSGNEKCDSSEDQFYGFERRGEIKLIDRSFTDLGYIGYGEGIRLEQLDTMANWQFV